MPVIMFSTLTEAGTNASVEALRLGAVDCFPKPKVATQGEFDVILGKLGKCIRNAKGAPARRIKVEKPAAAFAWNGRLLAIGADASSTSNLFSLLGSFPATCPPTIIVQHVRADLAGNLIEKLDEQCQAKVRPAEDGAMLEPGTVYIASPGEAHIIVDKWPGGQLKLMPRDPIAGERPSISLLFASIAKASAGEVVGMLLTQGGEDGQAGIKAILASGGHVVAQGAEGQEPGYYLYKGMASQPVTGSDIATTALKLCNK